MELPEVPAPLEICPCCHLLPGPGGSLGFSCSLPHAVRFALHLLFVVIADLCILQSAAWGTHLDSLQ